MSGTLTSDSGMNLVASVVHLRDSIILQVWLAGQAEGQKVTVGAVRVLDFAVSARRYNEVRL